MLLCALNGNLVAGIGMTHDAGCGVIPQHALDTARRILAAVAYNHHAGMLREAHPNPAAMVQRNPGSSGSRVQQRVEQRPVGYGIGAVLHRFRLAVGRSNRARIEMIPADHYRRLQLSLGHHLVEGEAETMAVAQPDPADTSRKTLERDAFSRHVEPFMQMVIAR